MTLQEYLEEQQRLEAEAEEEVEAIPEGGKNDNKYMKGFRWVEAIPEGGKKPFLDNVIDSNAYQLVLI
jgi:hypothetical protein